MTMFVYQDSQVRNTSLGRGNQFRGVHENNLRATVN